VPADPRNDKALNLALDLMRGIKVNSAFPSTLSARKDAN
jgi:carboxyl-terminal processing protease